VLARLNTAQLTEPVVLLSPQAKPAGSEMVAAKLLLSSEARGLRKRSQRLREESEKLRERNALLSQRANNIARTCCELITSKL
jgi:hypothetical protein